MLANLENSAVATGMKRLFHCNPKERWFQRMFICHTVALISHATKVISPSKSSIVHELWYSVCSRWIEKRQRNQTSNCQHPLDHRKSKKVPEKHLFLLYSLIQSLCVDHNKLRKIPGEMRIPDHLTCLLRNLYAGQEATVRTGHGTADWFQIRKGVHQGSILSPCLFDLYAKCQAGWSTSWNQDCQEKYQ